MANEIRKIEFSMVEVHAALQIFSAKTGQKIPAQPVLGVKADGVGTGRLKIDFTEGTAGLTLRDKDLLTALLVFCQDKNIPVPKGGKKVMKAEGTKVTMLIKLD